MPTESCYELLEFNKIKQTVASCAVLSPTKNKINISYPSFDLIEIKHALSLTQEAYVSLFELLLNPIVPFDDVSELLEKSKVDVTLSMGELLKVARLLRSARIAKSTIAYAPDDKIKLLKQLTEGLYVDKQIETNIFDVILNEFEISDGASDKLYGLRRKIASLKIKLKEKLFSYTKNNESSKYLQDNLVTVRDGRYVLPVKAECRGEVGGIVHDRSSSGSTVFVEPFAIVELNNELRFAIGEEQAEVERILRDFTKRVCDVSDALFITQEVCVNIDEAFAKAKYSESINGIAPSFNDDGIFKIKAIRHPLIDKDKVVPIDLAIGGEYSILMITGPNTGGKTVTLKTMGLASLMAYFGLYLPCVEANLCVYDDIFCDIGDNQSIESELSTFSSHITSLINIVNSVTNKSLVLLDELCGGTDPDEGAALALGFISRLLEVKCSAILTTHYGQLKEYAMSASGIMNASMQFNSETFAPTYKLILGMPGTSNAIKIAKRLGVDEEIINFAESSLSKDKINLEKVLLNAEDIKRKSEAELAKNARLNESLLLETAELEKRRKQLDATMEKIRLNAAVETKRLVSGALERANQIIEEMKAKQAEIDSAALLRAKQLRSELEDIDYSMNSESIISHCLPIAEKEIKLGASVIVKSLDSLGVIKSVNPKRKEAEVQIGAVKMKVQFSNLGKPVEKKAEKKTDKKRSAKITGEQAPSGFTEREIMVLGYTVSEAVQKIEPFILSMYQENDAKILRIVHGKGTGALGKGIQAYLKTCPMIVEYRYGRYGEGDSGVTIVTIK